MKTRSQINQELADLRQEVAAYFRQHGKNADGTALSETTIQKGGEIVLRACFNNDYTVEYVTSEAPHLEAYCTALQLPPDEFFYVDIAQSFDSRHYQTLVGFIKRMESLLEAGFALDEEVEAAIYAAAEPEYLDYDELGCPDFVVALYSDHVEVKAFEKGVSEVIPRPGRKYIGSREDVRWRYPLSALPRLKALGRPFVDVVAIENAEGATPAG